MCVKSIARDGLLTVTLINLSHYHFITENSMIRHSEEHTPISFFIHWIEFLEVSSHYCESSVSLDSSRDWEAETPVHPKAWAIVSWKGDCPSFLWTSSLNQGSMLDSDRVILTEGLSQDNQDVGKGWGQDLKPIVYRSWLHCSLFTVHRKFSP